MICRKDDLEFCGGRVPATSERNHVRFGAEVVMYEAWHEEERKSMAHDQCDVSTDQGPGIRRFLRLGNTEKSVSKTSRNLHMWV